MRGAIHACNLETAGEAGDDAGVAGDDGRVVEAFGEVVEGAAHSPMAKSPPTTSRKRYGARLPRGVRRCHGGESPAAIALPDGGRGGHGNPSGGRGTRTLTCSRIPITRVRYDARACRQFCKTGYLG